MITPVKTTILATVHLKSQNFRTGQKLDVVFDPGREFTGDSLISAILQTFVTKSGRKYFVQGDNVTMIEVSEKWTTPS